MKKRLLSLLLALVVVFGVIAVPSFNSEAASKKVKYTKITPAKTNTAFTFTVTEKTKVKSAKQLNSVLVAMLPKNQSLSVRIDGVGAKITNKGKNIFVKVGDGPSKSLVSYVKATKTTKTSVSLTYNASAKKIFKAISIVKSSKASTNMGFKIGKAEFKVISLKNGELFFKAYGKTYRQGYFKDGSFYVKGDISKSRLDKTMKKDGTIKSAKVVKIAK